MAKVRDLFAVHVASEDVGDYNITEAGWYAVDDGERIVLGPFTSLAECERAIEDGLRPAGGKPMAYLNQCPECKSRNVGVIKRVRFRRTMLTALFVSGLTLWACMYDVLHPWVMITEHGHNEANILTAVTAGLWLSVIALACIKKSTYECKSCSLAWTS